MRTRGPFGVAVRRLVWVSVLGLFFGCGTDDPASAPTGDAASDNAAPNAIQPCPDADDLKRMLGRRIARSKRESAQ